MGSAKPENHPPEVPFDVADVADVAFAFADVAETSVHETSTLSAFFFGLGSSAAFAFTGGGFFSTPNDVPFVRAVSSANAFSAASSNVARNASAAESPASRYAVKAEAISPAAARASGAETLTPASAPSLLILEARFARQTPIAAPRRTPEGVVSSSSPPSSPPVSFSRVSRRAPPAPTAASRSSTTPSTSRATVSSALNKAVGLVLSVSAAVAAARARRASARIAKSAVHASTTKMAPAMPTARSRVTSVGRGIS